MNWVCGWKLLSHFSRLRFLGKLPADRVHERHNGEDRQAGRADGGYYRRRSLEWDADLRAKCRCVRQFSDSEYRGLREAADPQKKPVEMSCHEAATDCVGQARKRRFRTVVIKALVIPAPNTAPRTTSAQPPTSMALLIWDAAASGIPADPTIDETARLAPKIPTEATAAAVPA